MRGQHEVDTVTLEQRPERRADREVGAVLTASAIGGAVIDRDLPWLLRGREVRFQPPQLFLPARRILEGELGVERDDVNGTVVETVVALGMVGMGEARAVGREREKIEIGLAVRIRRPATGTNDVVGNPL
jgi:hypothetical protein